MRAKLGTHDKDDTKLLDECPFQCVLIAPVGRIGGGGLVFPEGSASTLLLNEGVCNEVVDEGRVDGGVGAGPKDDTGGGDDLEGVEHCGDIRARWEGGQGEDMRYLEDCKA